jgi:hypothetical protein
MRATAKATPVQPSENTAAVPLHRSHDELHAAGKALEWVSLIRFQRHPA